MSYVSNRSRRSSGSGHKLDMVENAKDKKKLNTKADPSKAIRELQPSMAALEAGNMDDLRAVQHKDIDGNTITDPDRSNPTRYRLERPLDTIRSFQMAAEGTSSNRRSTYSGRPVSQMNFETNHSRRSSYYGASGQNPQSRPRPNAGGYYRNNSYGFRPDSFVEEAPGASQQWPQRNATMRNASAPMYYNPNEKTPSPSHSHQQSYDNMTSGSDENSKSTNPSSQNSSFDQLHQLRKPDDGAYNGHHGYNGNFSSVSPARPYGPPGPYGGVQNGANGFQNGPPAPPKLAAPNNPRVPIKLDSGTGGGAEEFEKDFKQATTPKRKSWLKKRFSRRDS